MNRLATHEDIYSAINADLAESRTTRKEMACTLYPGRKPETAMGIFSRAMTADSTDVHLSVVQLRCIIQKTGGQNIIAYLCDDAGYDQPAKKSKAGIREEIRAEMQNMLLSMTALARRMETVKEED